MANPWAGEVALTVDGEPRVLKLTLGALAELEAALQEDTLIGLIERFEARRFSSRDVLALVVAGLRGGGWTGQTADLLAAEIEGGPIEAARVAGVLLVRAFQTSAVAG
ncbi:MAG: gene transfer agent family protein [Rhodobacter sp.]|nr:gene transfer agent family protein [Rhodobacter sp.]